MPPIRLIVTGMILLTVGAADAKDRVIRDGAAPQIGHERVYERSGAPVYSYEILEIYPHDPDDYTEALFMHAGKLYEGTGLYGKSRLKVMDLQTGTVEQQVTLDDTYFGEGAVALGDTVYHLTYLSNRGFSYDLATLQPKSSFTYLSQGWGLTTDGRELIMSNGSAAILFIDPDAMTVQRHVTVFDDIGAVGFLNELEYVEGAIYANVWQTNYIVRFAPETGEVTGWVDLTDLNPDPKSLVYPHVLNGIAYTGEKDTLLVTGKNWPNVWHIRLVPAAAR